MKHLLPTTETKHWMLVDDNAGILKLVSALVENMTDAPIERFISPQLALAAFAEAPEKYAVVITDFEMPGMDGVELCRRMLEFAPKQKIILSTGSGFFTKAVAQHAGFSGLLNKPFPIETLCATLTEAGVEMDLLTHA
jgi:CheY-like chemotaxis protein